MGIRASDMSLEDESFVDKLMDISGDVEKFMFCAIQYAVVAVAK